MVINAKKCPICHTDLNIVPKKLLIPYAESKGGVMAHAGACPNCAVIFLV